MKHCLLVFAAVVALAIGVPASAQYMFIDVDGNGICNSSDVLTASTTSVDVYVKTNLNYNGSAAVCPTGEPLTINSYTFILNAPSGGVTYGAWTDAMGFTINANPFPNGTGVAGNDIWIAKASGVIQPPGSYKMGTLALTVTGTPTLEFHASSTIDGSAITSFGCQCPGRDFDNTMKYDPTYPAIGDWGGQFGACGTASGTPVTETTWGKIKANYSH